MQKSAARILSEEPEKDEPSNECAGEMVQTIPAVSAPDDVALASVKDAVVFSKKNILKI